MEDGDEPYLDGIKYHAMPPLKRFRDMEHLSGGEKTMAALALLFAVHSYQPSPFFVLDEVDAALDNANVAKIAKYIRDHAGPGMQFIVISLKTGLFQGSEALVGIYRDQGANSSRALTLDVSFFLISFRLVMLRHPGSLTNCVLVAVAQVSVKMDGWMDEWMNAKIPLSLPQPMYLSFVWFLFPSPSSPNHLPIPPSYLHSIYPTSPPPSQSSVNLKPR